MSDYIANKRVFYEVCPNCKKKTLKVTEWDEHLEGWGFASYKVESFRMEQCKNQWCGWENV